MTKRRRAIVVIIVLLFTGVTGAKAEGTSPKALYSGALWSRSTLTGDWSGSRNELALKGVTFDFRVTQIGQGVVTGGKDTGWEYGGRGDLTLSVDTQKLGLWPGGFLTAEVEGNFGHGVNFQTGAAMTVDTNRLFPMPLDNQLCVPEVVFMQFLSHYFGVLAGKLDTTSGDANEFAHGKGDTQFFNLGFGVNPVALMVVPYSTLGAGLVLLPTRDPDSAIINFFVLDSEGKANTSGFDTVGHNGTAFAGEGRVRTDFFGLTGHQVLGGAYSNKRFTSIDQRIGPIIGRGELQKKSGSWAVYYNFDQYLYETKKGSGQGIGIFGRFGISDGNPNPVHHFYSIGIGGKGLMCSRPLDSFGIGYYYVNLSNPTIRALGTTRSFLRDEQGFEAFYSFAITPWMMFTPDIQVIKPAQKQSVSLGRREGIGGIEIPFVNRKNVDTAVVPGFRLQLVF